MQDCLLYLPGHLPVSNLHVQCYLISSNTTRQHMHAPNSSAEWSSSSFWSSNAHRRNGILVTADRAQRPCFSAAWWRNAGWCGVDSATRCRDELLGSVPDSRAPNGLTLRHMVPTACCCGVASTRQTAEFRSHTLLSCCTSWLRLQSPPVFKGGVWNHHCCGPTPITARRPAAV